MKIYSSNHFLILKTIMFKSFAASILFLVVTTNILFSQKTQESNDLDVISYEVQLEPNINTKYIKGKTRINFQIPASENQVHFQCGNLKISNVIGKSLKSYSQQKGVLTIYIHKKRDRLNTVEIEYEGTPAKGLIIQPENNLAYTVFHSNEWMICNFQPHDRASILIELTIPDSLNCVANGDLLFKKQYGNKQLKYFWKQSQETSSYTYGFAIGQFNNSEQMTDKTKLSYYSTNYTNPQLDSIFQYTQDMMNFFEEKSGVKYFQNTYSQILIGNHYQEMSGFAVLRDSYGKLVLKDSTETNLISHELAHQWWGNMITCKNWNHFWLNEGFATYMSAAYNQHRFGENKYQADINSYYKVYQDIKHKGFDKPLVFSNWDSPTKNDKNLVYFKGAYVLHRLRMELGDKTFWKAIKYYSQMYYGKSVTTQIFKDAIERSSQQNLDSFFKKWIN